jgi:hypothetical protein
MHRLRFVLLGLIAISAGSLLTAAEPAAKLLTGFWRLIPQRSTDLSPWRAFDLEVTAAASRVTLTRHLAAGRRTYDDVTALDLNLPVNRVPVAWWGDNRHLGAYIGGDKTKTVRAELLDGGRVLRTSADLVLATQQGERAINVLSDYKVSANGAQLTLTELRSTRNEPVVYVFERITDPKLAARRATGAAE